MTVVVYDIFRREIARLVDGESAARQHDVIWNSRTGEGLQVGTGVYFYKITAASVTKVLKMALVK